MAPPPEVPVDFRQQSDFNFASQSGPSCSFNTGSPSFSRPWPKSKPRLVKQRKSTKSNQPGQGLGSVDSGFSNPFRSVNDTSNCCSSSFSNQFDSSGFVFGVSNSNSSNSNSNVVSNCSVDGESGFSFSDIGRNRENNSNESEAFRFGGVTKGCNGVTNQNEGEFEVMDKLNKLNIDNGVKESVCFEENGGGGLDNEGSPKGKDCVFVFRTGGEGLEPLDSDGNNAGSLKGDRKGGEKFDGVMFRNVDNAGSFREGGEKFDGNNAGCLKGDRKGGEKFDGVMFRNVDNAGSFQEGGEKFDGNNAGCLKGDREGGEKFDEVVFQNVDNVFVFGSNAKFAKQGDCSSECKDENEGAKENGDVLFSSFMFSSLGDEVGTDGCSLPGEKNEFKGCFTGLDTPLPFSGNFSCGLDSKLESSVRNRGLKDRNSKKMMGKPKQSRNNIKSQPVQTPISSEGVTQGQEVPECYSPMDFSPYEDVTNSVVPPSDPPTCRNSCDVPREPQFNVTGTEKSKMDEHGGDSNSFSIGLNETSSQNHVSSLKRVQRRKYRMKPASKVQGFSLGSTPLSKSQAMGGNVSASAIKDKQKTEAGDEVGCNAFSDAEKACEKWRRRGNEAYEKGELSNAEDFYTWGVNCIPLNNASDVAFRPLVRCYSNRAATRMALGRVREAIQDCLMAVKFDPSFHRAQIRAANCYLQLGEVEEAIQCFDKCLDSGNVVCLDRQVVISASEGIQMSQKVIECSSCSAELLKLRTAEAATDALQYIAEAMTISIHSEKLLELKAQALCILSRHEEVISLCQKTHDFAVKNFTDSVPGCQKIDGSLSNVKLWRYHTLVKCQFHLGNLEAALDLLENQEFRNKTQELSEIAVTIHELLKQKNAGNTAFHSGKHLEAIEHYTSAIYISMESRPFSAICLCNRAAAYQALGQITDAIADCSLAMVLDENYAKAVSRRATLHEMIRHYRQAAADLQKLLTHHRQSLGTSKHSGSGKGKELRQVQQRLSVVEEEAKKDIPLDLYLILGSKKGDSISEIKKAYRKAALKHHPDKAAQSLVKSGEVGEEGRHWKDIAELVHKDSDRLFKIIGEAYAVLSDPTKREEYDHDEDMRKLLKESNNIRTNSRRNSEHYSQGYPFERSSSRRYWQDSYRTYGYSHRK